MRGPLPLVVAACVSSVELNLRVRNQSTPDDPSRMRVDNVSVAP